MTEKKLKLVRKVATPSTFTKFRTAHGGTKTTFRKLIRSARGPIVEPANESNLPPLSQRQALSRAGYGI